MHLYVEKGFVKLSSVFSTKSWKLIEIFQLKPKVPRDFLQKIFNLFLISKNHKNVSMKQKQQACFVNDNGNANKLFR